MERRAFLRQGALYLAGLSCGSWLARRALADPDALRPALRIGLIADLHHADKKPAGKRHYRESIPRVRVALERFRAESADLVVELGDFIDSAPTVEEELVHLKAMEKVFATFTGPRHYVLGNHCVHTLTKQEFLDHTAARKSYYSFDHGGLHFVILDACFRGDEVPYGRKNFTWTDTEIPRQEREWLAADLEKTSHKTIVFVHQRLDLDPPSHYLVKSAAGVRKILEESGKVLTVFQGHNHVNDLREVRGIHYCTLPAVVEGAGLDNNAYGLLEVYADGSQKLNGFARTRSYEQGKLTRV